MSQADWFARRVGYMQALQPGFQAAYGSTAWKLYTAISQGDADVDALVQQGARNASLADATGAALVGIGAGYGVLPTAAVAATVPVVFSLSPVNASAATVIPAGAVVMTPAGGSSGAVQFVTGADATIPANSGSSNTVTATCLATGTAGNVPAGSITIPYSGVPAGVTVSNPAAGGSSGYVAGANQESDDSYRAAIYDAIQNKTAAARIEGVALQQSGTWGSVFDAHVVDAQDTKGNYTLYVCDDQGNAGASLQSAVRSAVLAMANIGLTLTVAGVTLVSETISGTYTLQPGAVSATVQSGIQTTILAWMNGLKAGANLYPTDLILACYGQKAGIAAVPGLLDLTITAPAAPVSATATQIIRSNGTPSFSLGSL